MNDNISMSESMILINSEKLKLNLNKFRESIYGDLVNKKVVGPQQVKLWIDSLTNIVFHELTDSQSANKNTPTLSSSSLTVNTYESELINIDSQDNNNTDLDSGLNSDVNSQENNNLLENDIISRIDKLEKTVQTLVNNEVNFQNKVFGTKNY